MTARGGLRSFLTAPWRLVRSLRDPDARQGAALLFTAGGGISVTIYAGWALYLVRQRPQYAFWLGVGALFIIAIVITGFISIFSKRTIEASIAGNRLVIADAVQQAVQQTVAPAVAAGVAAAVASTPPPVDPELDKP